MALIEAKNIEKIYGKEVKTYALKGVSLKIEKGEFVSIMGPSGSGKSTLLHILGFLDRQTSGLYLFDGKSMDDYSPEKVAMIRNKKMGFVFQAFNLLPRTSVIENVKMPLIYSDVDESKWDEMAERAMEMVGISHRKSYEPSKLSGGERQRTAIARALVNNPDVIFMDEPTGNLDSKSSEQILAVVKKLHREGHTIILITHDERIAKNGERVLHLFDGEIIKDEKL